MSNLYNKEEKRNSISASAVARIVIWSVVLVLLLGVFVAAMLAQESSFYLGRILWDDWEYDDDDFNVGNGAIRAPIRELSIDWVAGSVTVEATDGEEILITEDYDGTKSSHRLRWLVEDGELTVKYAKPSFFGNTSDSKNLTVSIPRTMLDDLDEIRVAGVSTTQNILVSARELDVETTSGSVTVAGNYTSVEMEAVSGDLRFEGTMKQGSFEGVSARVELRLKEQAERLDLESVSGRLTVILPEDTTGFKVVSNRVSGNTEVRGFDFDNGDSSIWGDGSMRINVDGVSCKLFIEKETGN